MSERKSTNGSLVGAGQAIRRTVAGRAEVAGVGLFTGYKSRLTIAPWDDVDGGGVVFVRTDLPGLPRVRAVVGNVSRERRRTLLVTEGAGEIKVEVHTVEHVLSALAGLGVTDAVVEVEGCEVPIGDGSATPFVEAIQSAGVRVLDEGSYAAIERIEIRRPMVVSEGSAEIVATPWDGVGCEMVYELDYGAAGLIPAQSASLRIGVDGVVEGYAEEVARARTFCLLEEAVAMRTMGMFQGFEPKDLLVIGPEGPVDNVYRFTNEPARHKLLDMLGDLSLAGRPIQGRLVARRSGHALNHQMASALYALAGQ